MSTSEPTTLLSLDGLTLAATLVRPAAPTGHSAVLVHGGGVTRDEGGFFTRLADGLAEAGVTSLRFDLRGHGDSEGRQEDLTLAAILNDIRVAVRQVRRETGGGPVSLLGASFSGGTCAYYAAKRTDEIDRLVLLNPQLDYKQRTIDARPFWHDDQLVPEAAKRLGEDGFIAFRPTLRHGRAFFNEVFWFDVASVMGDIRAPTLLVHGTADTFIPIEGTRRNLPKLRTEYRFIELQGAQHGFAVDNDPEYHDPQTNIWQAEVTAAVAAWVSHSGHNRPSGADRLA